ncbi:hypothetical protein [Kibdelosporangium philippinense]|uniref:hypothetical protein n=1 Tax=Kibdelosporangium philippinense TaxID=211113 RepID=UPI003614CA70
MALHLGDADGHGLLNSGPAAGASPHADNTNPGTTARRLAISLRSVLRRARQSQFSARAAVSQELAQQDHHQRRGPSRVPTDDRATADRRGRGPLLPACQATHPGVRPGSGIKPTTVAGYPAGEWIQSTGADGSFTSCQYIVDIAETQGFGTLYNGPSGEPIETSCAHAKELADSVIAAIPR